MLSAKQGGIKYYFWAFGMTQPGIEPRSLTIMPMSRENSIILVYSFNL